MDSLMQSKVSIVMPVYNKIEYIDMCLKSVHDQEWDNIELVLVNDGATDGTGERLLLWEPRFRARGYGIVIICQDNQGIPAAVKAGLLVASGDYIALADCDDFLDRHFVSAMASHLDDNHEDSWVACRYSRVSLEGGRFRTENAFDSDFIPRPPHMMEKYLSGKYATEVWLYMVRSSYLKRCKVTEHFITNIRSTQEPCFLFPLIIGGGKLGFIDRPLYNHNNYPSRTAKYISCEYAIEFQGSYRDMIIKAINNLDVDSSLKRKWKAMAEFMHNYKLLPSLARLDINGKYIKEFSRKAASLISKHFTPDPCISAEHILEKGYAALSEAICDCIHGRLPPALSAISGRVIGCGALGKVGRIRIEQLVGSPLEPTELWDSAASKGDTVCSIPVTAPDFDSLSPKDTIIVFPHEVKIKSELTSAARKSEVGNIIKDEELLKIRRVYMYPQFYRGCEFVF